jgi:hypothetical protein
MNIVIWTLNKFLNVRSTLDVVPIQADYPQQVVTSMA